MMVHFVATGESKSTVDTSFVELVERLAQQLQLGQPVNLDELARDHPEHLPRLQQMLPAMRAAADLGAARTMSAAIGPTATCAEGDPYCLGEFRLIREIGRGGMGIVYEAEQLTLSRRVALKVMPFAAILNPRQLERFKNEAKAAATLHHPNIVPVYSVGCDRGVHYYAMQYIEGYSLANVLEKLREAKSALATEVFDSESDTSLDAATPTEEAERKTPSAVGTQLTDTLSTEYSCDRARFFQHVADLTIGAAEALEHAHFHGILHRDIKPANLLLDVEGRLWVTDFGLARLERDAGMTLTGDVMGTLRYMSPEQAQGERHIVDPRTDVYSLGATLYEILALQPVFTSNDHAKLLRQISDEEPRPLRSLDRRVPADLETIVLKALQKFPEHRYASAQAMADDVRRFLEHKPIHAKPPTRWVRALRWSRRNNTLVLSTTAVLLVSMLLLAVGSALLFRSYRQQVALRSEAEIAAQHQDEALKTAVQAIDEMYFEVAEKLLITLPAQTPRRREFLEKALQAYENVLKQKPTDPDLRHSIAKVCLSLAKLELAGFPPEQRKPWFDRSIGYLTHLAAEYPDVEEYRASLASAWMYYGWMMTPADIEGLEPVLAMSARVAEENTRRHPDSWPALSELSVINMNLASQCYVAGGRYADALALLTRTLALTREVVDDANEGQIGKRVQVLEYWVAKLHYLLDRGRSREYRKCLERLCARPDQATKSPGMRSTTNAFNFYFTEGERLQYVSQLARLQLDEGEPSAALDLLNESLEGVRGLLSKDPDVMFYQHQYGSHLWLRGEIFWRLGRLAEARADMAEAMERLEDVMESEVVRMLVICPFRDLQDPQRTCTSLKSRLTVKPRVDDCITEILAKYRLGEYETALRRVDHYRATVFEKEDPALSFLRAACLHQLDQRDQAAAAFSAAQDAYAARPAYDGCDIICHEVMQLFEREASTVGATVN